MPKIPFFFWSDYGSTLFLAKRLKHDGHPVLLYIYHQEAQNVGRGIVPKTTNPVPPPGSLVIFDGIGHGLVGREFRKKGHAVIGGNPFDKTLEADRPAGIQIMRAAGITVPETHEFRSIPTAIKFLERQTGTWFIKAIGLDTPEAATYNDPSERLIRYLRWLQSHKLDHFQLSHSVSGIEISLNGWFNGQEFIRPFDLTLEEKHFLPGDLGPRTGCEANAVWMAQDDTLAKQTVLLIEDELRAHEYVGPVDLNSLIGEDGDVTGLEWTARLGFDAIQAWSHLFDNTLGEQLDAFARGALAGWEPSGSNVSATVRVSMPPYPLWEPRVAQKSKGVPVDPRWLTDPVVTIDDVMLGPDGPQMAGRDGYIGTAGAMGPTLSVVTKELFDTAKTMWVPNKQYRVYAFDGFTEDARKLAHLGLLGRPGL